MANLLIEIGNTALKAAWTEGVTLGKTYRYQGEKILHYIQNITAKEKPSVMTVASVKPLTDEQMRVLAGECSHLLVLDPIHCDYLNDYAIPQYMSYDRASSVIAARYLFKGKDCSIFDFGTTLTVDFVNNEGHYRGGNISPGCRTRFKSLNRYAKSLPLVDTPEKIHETGSSTESSIESGVISGIMFEINGYIRQYPQNIVVFTGGDAIYFAKRMKNSIFVVCNLVLIGLALITEDYVKKSIQ